MFLIEGCIVCCTNVPYYISELFRGQTMFISIVPQKSLIFKFYWYDLGIWIYIYSNNDITCLLCTKKHRLLSISSQSKGNFYGCIVSYDMYINSFSRNISIQLIKKRKWRWNFLTIDCYDTISYFKSSFPCW